MSERRPLSKKAKWLVRALAVVLVALIGASSVALIHRAIDGRRARETRSRLERVAALLHGHAMPHSSNVRSDPTGQAALAKFCVTLIVPADVREPIDVNAFGSSVVLPSAFDAWRQPLVYRCPGPVHTRGWDLYSVGPDGLDDQGRGDDILVGEEEPERVRHVLEVRKVPR